jgi:hypothetical protein
MTFVCRDLVSYTGSYSFMYTYSAPKPAVINMWKSVLTEVLTGGWDQDQFRYWGTKMHDSINSFVMSTNFVPRAQNSFVRVLLGRLSRLEDPTARNMLSKSPLLTSPLPVVGASQSEWPRIWEAMTNTYPHANSGFVSWDPSSPCADKLVGEKFSEWSWRKQCAASLITVALWTGRYAILPDIAHGIYDVMQLSNWFPIMLEGKLSTILQGALPSERDTLRLRENDPNVDITLAALRNPKHVTRIAYFLPGDWAVRLNTGCMCCIALQNWIELRGDASSMSAFTDANCNMPANVKQQLDLFVAPAPPDRLQFQCMRRGGPASEGNPDPSCSSRSHRQSWEHFQNRHKNATAD